jgi:hypothetical protein
MLQPLPGKIVAGSSTTELTLTESKESVLLLSLIVLLVACRPLGPPKPKTAQHICQRHKLFGVLVAM